MKIFKFLITFLLIFSISFGIIVEEIVQKVVETYNKLNTFSSILEIYNREGNKEEFSIYEFYFQKPDIYRLNMIEGRDKGAVAILRDGKVRGHHGGLLRFIILTVNPDDPLVLSIRKGRIDESGLEYVVQQLTQGSSLKLIGEENIAGYLCYVLEMGLSKDRLHTYVSQKFYIDKNTFIPIQLEQYENYNGVKTLTHRRTYKNYKINPNLDPNIFKI
ncbi:MAG: LolA family protein [Dictyoglomaceae bacterium]